MNISIQLDHNETVELRLHEASNNLDLFIGDISIMLSQVQIARLEESMALVPLWRQRIRAKKK